MSTDDFELADFIVVRTPLLPFREMQNIAGAVAAPARDASEAEQARRVIGERLYTLFAQPALQQSLLVASRSLYERTRKCRAGSQNSTALKTQRSLMKYLARATYRCTPFGLFAGISWYAPRAGKTPAAHSGIVLSPADTYLQHARIDMGVIGEIRAKLLADRQIRRSLKYFRNPTLHKSGCYWHYLADRCGLATLASYATRGSPHLDGLLDAMDQQPTDRSFDDLLSLLGSAAAEPFTGDRVQFIDELIKSGIVLSTLEPRLTGGGDPLDDVLLALRECVDHPAYSALADIRDLLEQIRASPIGEGQEAFRRIAQDLGTFLGTRAASDVVQVDLQKPLQSAYLQPSIIASVRAGIDALLALSPTPPTDLQQFYQAFLDRYGERQVPLLEVFDPAIGLPFGGEEDDALPMGEGSFPAAAAADETCHVGKHVRALLLRKWEAACHEGIDEIVLSGEDIASLQQASPKRPPESFFVIVSVVRDAHDQSRVVLRDAGGPPGARILARFCSVDPGLAEHTRRYCSDEESNADRGAIFAEIVHWPGHRAGNVLFRTQLRATELPIFGNASAERSRQINLRDILISPESGRIVLRCRKSGRIIVPRQTAAYTVRADSTPIYRFLGSLQSQESVLSRFRWPSALSYAPRLPRVVYKNCVLSPQIWQLGRGLLDGLNDRSIAECYDIVQKWREALRWPRYIELAQGDEHLLVDLNNPLSVDCLVVALRQQSLAIIREALTAPPAGFVRDSDGAEFCHELVLPFVRTATTQDLGRGACDATEQVAGAPRAHPVRHVPGGEWLYAKIYASPWGREQLLRQCLVPLVTRLLREQLADKWFFIRYADPDPHLRVRLHGDAATLWNSALPRIRTACETLCSEGLAWKIDIATYEPEIERYGGQDALSIAEDVFGADSECVLALIVSGAVQDPHERWKCLIAGVDLIWKDAGFDEASRAALYARRSEQLVHSLGADPERLLATNRKFRASRLELDQLLFGDSADGGARSILQRRSERLQPLLASLRQLAAQQRLTQPLSKIVAAHAHMYVNRLSLAASGTQELIVYEMLAKLLASRVARQR